MVEVKAGVHLVLQQPAMSVSVHTWLRLSSVRVDVSRRLGARCG
jgi:hypothetical protein